MEIVNQREHRSLWLRWRMRVSKYTTVMKVSIASNLAYMGEVFFRAAMMFALIFVLSQLWKVTYSARGAHLLQGFSLTSIIWYLVAAECMAMSLPQLSRRIGEEVRSGQLAYLLGKPCSYVLYNFAHYLGERVVRFMMNCLLGILIGLIVAGLPQLSWQGLAAWPLVIFLAMSIDFIVYFAIGLLAFWIEETQSFVLIVNRMTLVLGGVLAPLELFPQPLRMIAQVLPFSAILYGPARTLVHFDWSNFVQIVWLQLLMLTIGGVLLLVLYRIAIRHVNINGG